MDRRQLWDIIGAIVLSLGLGSIVLSLFLLSDVNYSEMINESTSTNSSSQELCHVEEINIHLDNLTRAVREEGAKTRHNMQFLDRKCGDTYLELPTDPLNNILNSVSNIKDYELNVYDCTEFSENMAGQLKEAGYDARTKLVTVDCDSGLLSNSTCGDWKNNHQIVKVIMYVEATTGTFITADEYELYGLD